MTTKNYIVETTPNQRLVLKIMQDNLDKENEINQPLIVQKFKEVKKMKDENLPTVRTKISRILKDLRLQGKVRIKYTITSHTGLLETNVWEILQVKQ